MTNLLRVAQSVGIALTQRLKLQQQWQGGVGVALSHFLEVNSLEVEEELSTMATLAWAEGVWGRWRREHLKAWKKQICEFRHGDT